MFLFLFNQAQTSVTSSALVAGGVPPVRRKCVSTASSVKLGTVQAGPESGAEYNNLDHLSKTQLLRAMQIIRYRSETPSIAVEKHEIQSRAPSRNRFFIRNIRLSKLRISQCTTSRAPRQHASIHMRVCESGSLRGGLRSTCAKISRIVIPTRAARISVFVPFLQLRNRQPATLLNLEP